MSDIQDKRRTKAENPATGQMLGYSRLHSKEELVQMISKARQAQKLWAVMKISERRNRILKIRKFIVKQVETLTEVIARDNGKTRIDALATEVLPATLAVTYYCKKAKSFLKEQKLSSSSFVIMNKRSRVIRVPYGVIGIISPWNYPFTIPFSEIIMGLLAGNAVILKTASETQMVGLALKESIEAAGLPEGVFQYVNMPGRVAGDAFLESGIDKLFFTGSVPVGKKLMAKASETLTPVCLELGGNDAMIVCSDADPERAAAGAVWAGFQNAGQSCGGVERIYVHQAVYDCFMKKLKEYTERLKVGYDEDYTIDMGVMTAERQVKTVKQHVDDALSKGAEIYARSRDPERPDLKNVHPAVVLTNVKHDMQVMKEETFGPVVAVMNVASDKEAIELANDSNLGLTGSVWSKNRLKARRIARQIKAGTVTINDHLMSHGLPETAWGGFKESGIGRTHGKLGFDEMTQAQTIVDDVLPGVRKDLWWHPFNKRVYDGLRGLIHMLYGESLGKRISGTWRVLKILPRMFSAK